MSRIAILEILRREWERPGTVELVDTAIEMRIAAGERVLPADVASFVVDTIGERGIVATVGENVTITASPPETRRVELAVGELVRFVVQGERPNEWVLRLVAIRTVDARSMPGGSAVERQLLLAIREAPAEDHPRLVYADWLLSQPAQGDRDRGELIQLQCALATAAALPPERRREARVRERELLATQPAPAFEASVQLELIWSRGFLELCRGQLGDFMRHATTVFQLAPMLAKLKLTVPHVPNQSAVRRLATVEQLAQIREVVLAPPADAVPAGNELLTILAPAFAELRRLRAPLLRINARGVAALVSGPACAQLAVLDLSRNPIGSDGARALAECAQLRPSVLRLAGCELYPAQVEALATAPWLADVEELDLGNNELRDPGALALARVPFRRLRRLALGSCSIGRVGGSTLLQSPHLALLRMLRLHNNPIGDDGARALAASRSRSIEDLDLQSCAIGDAGAAALADSSKLRALRRWRLGGNPIGDLGARSIAASDSLRALESLDLGRCQVGDIGASALASIARALELTLTNNPLGDEGAATLIASHHHLILSRESLSEAMRAALDERATDRTTDDV